LCLLLAIRVLHYYLIFLPFTHPPPQKKSLYLEETLSNFLQLHANSKVHHHQFHGEFFMLNALVPYLLILLIRCHVVGLLGCISRPKRFYNISTKIIKMVCTIYFG